MLPLKDENPTQHHAYVTIALIAVCVIIYFFVQPGGQTVVRHNVSREVAQQEDAKFTFEHAAIPCEVVHDRPLTVDEIRTKSCESRTQDQPIFPGKNVYLAILYSMFLHGSILHIAGNMLFLWVFGNNIEDKFGIVPYIIFYLAAGVVATMAFVLSQPASVIPLVGASGAIAGVMGVYLVLFPNVQIKTLIIIVPPFLFFRNITAKWLLGFWLVSQFFLSPGSGVAWMAHVGGFVFGAIVGLAYRSVAGPPARLISPSSRRPITSRLTSRGW